jgi:hypothetical protein
MGAKKKKVTFRRLARGIAFRYLFGRTMPSQGVSGDGDRTKDSNAFIGTVQRVGGAPTRT